MTLKDFMDRYGVALGVLFALVLAIVVLPDNTGGRAGVDTGFGDFGASDGGDPFAAPTPAAGGDPFAGSGTADPSAPVTAADPANPTPAAGGSAGSTSGGSTGGSTGGAPAATTPAAGGGAGGSGGSGGGGGGASTPPAGGGQPAVVFGQGPNCRPDGRQVGISFYNPICVQWNGGDNGGSTFRGVSGDEILIVKYRAQLDPGTEAILAGANLGDSAQVVDRAQRALLRYWNTHAETYGREVVFQHVDASGPPTSEEASRADALRIANDIKPFAVIQADPAAPLPTLLSRELAQRGVLCMCTGQSTPLSSKFYTDVPPALFTELPTMDEYAAHTAEYIGKKMEGRPAEFAGDDQTVGQTFTTSERKYGLLYVNGQDGVVDPVLLENPEIMKRELAKVGVGGDRIVEVGYNYQPGRNQSDLTNVATKFKAEGVTTIIPIWDPLTPVLLTQEATRQQYFPEWLNIGIGLSDTTTGGRLYDQGQWQNSFGLSPLWVTWEDVRNSPGYREFHHGCPECQDGDEGVLINIYRERIETLFIGLQSAGPNLTNETFVRAMFEYPPTGGLPGAPLQRYTRQFPSEISDFTEIWYDVDRQGPDERGEVASGMVVKAQGGKRYDLGQWTSEQFAFVEENVATVSDTVEGADPPHEQDGHTHENDGPCLSCS